MITYIHEVVDTFTFVADTIDYVASVYGAKATWSTLSTFNKVDRVELNFIASEYRRSKILELELLQEQSILTIKQ